MPGRGWEGWRNWPLLAARGGSDGVVDESEAEELNSASPASPQVGKAAHGEVPRRRGGVSPFLTPVATPAATPFLTPLATEDKKMPPHTPPTPTLWRHLLREFFWGHSLSPRKLGLPAEHMLNFLRVTFALEPFLTFGHVLCIDLFLFHFTLLPLRCVAALWVAACSLCGSALRWKRRVGVASAAFTNAHAYDMIKGALLIAAATALGAVQVSRVYHYIRGEAIIKLYVIFNILEIFDKLACSLGQDVMDGLYRTTRDHLALDGCPGSRRAMLLLGFHFVVAVIYVVSHALILFVQIVCLNVAINSRNNALFTLLISNNFMELKASVFKKFEAENLFQVACSDAVERFQLGLFLLLIGVQELRSSAAVTALLPPMLAIYLCEVRSASPSARRRAKRSRSDAATSRFAVRRPLPRASRSLFALALRARLRCPPPPTADACRLRQTFFRIKI